MLKKLNYSSSQKSLNLNSIKYGENGINFVLLHGMSGSGKNWSTFATSFKGNVQIWTLDARNHGDSHYSDNMSSRMK